MTIGTSKAVSRLKGKYLATQEQAAEVEQVMTTQQYGKIQHGH